MESLGNLTSSYKLESWLQFVSNPESPECPLVPAGSHIRHRNRRKTRLRGPQLSVHRQANVSLRVQVFRVQAVTSGFKRFSHATLIRADGRVGRGEEETNREEETNNLIGRKTEAERVTESDSDRQERKASAVRLPAGVQHLPERRGRSCQPRSHLLILASV